MGVMRLFDSVIIGEHDSYYDFDASMKEREIGEPKKKSIKETVPFSNKIYDFTQINGEIYWEERILTYVFEIMADSPMELERKKQDFKKWIMNIHEEELHDPYIEDYHFVATFDEMSCDDSEIEKSTITVTFTAYPYMISDKTRVYTVNATEEEQEVKIYVNSCHKITPRFLSEVPFVLQYGYTSYEFDAGLTEHNLIRLKDGLNYVYIKSTRGEGKIGISFYEEVF